MEKELKVEHWDEAQWGVLSSSTMRRKLESEGYHCSELTFSPGTEFYDHAHDHDKKDGIVAGNFRFAMYGQEVVLKVT